MTDYQTSREQRTAQRAKRSEAALLRRLRRDVTLAHEYAIVMDRIITDSAPACVCGTDHDCRSTGCDDDCEACGGVIPDDVPLTPALYVCTRCDTQWHGGFAGDPRSCPTCARVGGGK